MSEPTAVTSSEIISAMVAAVGPARAQLDWTDTSTLRHLTTLLLRARSDQSDSRRFHDTVNRSLVMPQYPAPPEGRTVLVTGGTGCIGSVLLRRLAIDQTNRIYSVSRGVTPATTHVPGVTYLQLDIRDEAEVRRTFRTVRPDVVYHLAAVRDPALAEVEVARTIATNVLGTANLIAAAHDVAVDTFVYASTGKAVRFYTGDVYAATKKIGERLVSSSGLPRCSFVRYTHVVDNSLIMQKLAGWCAGGLIRLHGPDIAFYVQSALESAQLLQVAARRAGLYTIRDLAWPVRLLDLALDRMRESGQIAPIYFCGYEPGYEAAGYPGLYDPDVSGDTGPLINAVEAYSATTTLGGQLNHVPIAVGDRELAQSMVSDLKFHCAQDSSAILLRQRLADASHAVLTDTLAQVAPARIDRLTELATRYRSDTEEHHLIGTAIVAQGLANRERLYPPRRQCVQPAKARGAFFAPGRYPVPGRHRSG